MKFYIEKAVPNEVSSIAVLDGDKILMGKRRDNGRWTLPGGHCELDSPLNAAKRELFEESGLYIDRDCLEFLGKERVKAPTGQHYLIHAYLYRATGGKTTSKFDPDEEVQRWEWIDISDGLPEKILSNLHSPKNTVLSALGLQKSYMKRFYEEIMDEFYIQEKKTAKAEIFILDLLKAKPHKYIRKYRHNNKWVYIYHEAKGRKGRQLSEEAFNSLKRLAELGDTSAKQLVDSLREHHPEKIRALMRLASLGDERAQRHIEELGLREIKLEKEIDIPVPDQPLDLTEEELQGEKRDKALSAIRSSIARSMNHLLVSHRSSDPAKALIDKNINDTTIYENVMNQKSLKDMMEALHKEMSKIDRAHQGLTIRNYNASDAGGYGNLIYNTAVQRLEQAGVLPEGYSQEHKRQGSGKLEMPRADELERRAQERRRKEEEALRRENAELLDKHGENLNEMMSYFGSNLSKADKVKVMKGLDKAFGKDFSFKNFVKYIQGHPGVEVKVNDFTGDLISQAESSHRGIRLDFLFSFIDKETQGRITTARRGYSRGADGAFTWTNAVFNRPSNESLAKFPGMAKGLYAGVEKLLKETTKDWSRAEKNKSQIVIGYCANDGFGNRYKGALVWAKHYFDFSNPSTAESWKVSYASRIDRYAQRAGIKPESVKAFKDKINEAKYPYQFVKTGFMVTKQEALKMTGRRSLDSDFNKIFQQKGYCDIGEIIMIDAGLTWSGVNKFASTDTRSKHLNELRTKYYDKQPVPKPDKQQFVIDESLIQLETTPSQRAARAPPRAPQSRISNYVNHFWAPRRGRRNITITERRRRVFASWPLEDQKDFLRQASLTPNARRQLRALMRVPT